MNPTKNLTSVKIYIIFSIIYLLYIDIGCACCCFGRCRAKKCEDELSEVFGTSQDVRTYLLFAFLETDRHTMHREGRFALGYFEYLFSRIVAKATLLGPSEYCTEKTTAYTAEVECKRQCREAKFLMASIRDGIPTDTTIIALKDSLESEGDVLQAERLRIVHHAYIIIGPDQLKENDYLRAYIEYIATDEDALEIKDVDSFVVFCKTA